MFFRQAFPFADSKTRIAVSADDLDGEIEGNSFAIYRRLPSGKAHPDYGAAVFRIRRGDILAIGEGLVFPIESFFDAMRPIGSIMAVVENPESGNLPIKVDLEGDKILVLLTKKDFADYKLLKISGTGEALATTVGVVRSC